MRPRIDLALVSLSTLGLLAAGVAFAAPNASKTETAAPSRAQMRERAKAIFGVLPAEATSKANPITPEKVTLGRMLYYEPRLSKDQKISCNSCHPLLDYGVDHQPTSVGHKGQHGARNAPTVYNAAFEIAQFWDGRAADVEEQAKGPILNPAEMGMSGGQDVVSVLRSIPGYAQPFRKAFPGEADPITLDNVARAIGAFERKLVTPSRFDDFLNGDDHAYSDAEVKGLATFMDVGCPTCHNGPTVGGHMFQKMGLVHPYPTKDLGRYDVTKKASDKHVFKVPMLRNIAQTGPYFSDASAPTLEDAVRKMGWHQLGRRLTNDQIASIVTFLQTLTGRIDLEYVAKPELPPSGPNTPGPDPS